MSRSFVPVVSDPTTLWEYGLPDHHYRARAALLPDAATHLYRRHRLVGGQGVSAQAFIIKVKKATFPRFGRG